jgi:hypothetical protein
MKKILLGVALFMYSYAAISATQDLEAATKDPVDPVSELSNFGFGPAFFMISYDEEVLVDSKDVRLRGDGSIDSAGTKAGTAIGLEVHYDFSIKPHRKGYIKPGETETTWTHSNGYVVSPFIGLYDIDNGINGLAAGVMFGYWKGDNSFQNRTSLNMGIGYTVHRNQLVLSRGVEEGVAPPEGLTVEDYTTRKDVNGMVLMISVSTDF